MQPMRMRFKSNYELASATTGLLNCLITTRYCNSNYFSSDHVTLIQLVGSEREANVKILEKIRGGYDIVL
jgi:hypothetical protein